MANIPIKWYWLGALDQPEFQIGTGPDWKVLVIDGPRVHVMDRSSRVTLPIFTIQGQIGYGANPEIPATEILKERIDELGAAIMDLNRPPGVIHGVIRNMVQHRHIDRLMSVGNDRPIETVPGPTQEVIILGLGHSSSILNPLFLGSSGSQVLTKEQCEQIAFPTFIGGPPPEPLRPTRFERKWVI